MPETIEFQLRLSIYGALCAVASLHVGGDWPIQNAEYVRGQTETIQRMVEAASGKNAGQNEAIASIVSNMIQGVALENRFSEAAALDALLKMGYDEP